jgi:hypothetical protein
LLPLYFELPQLLICKAKPINGTEFTQTGLPALAKSVFQDRTTSSPLYGAAKKQHAKPPKTFSAHRRRIERASAKSPEIAGPCVWQMSVKEEANGLQITVYVDIECRWLEQRRRKTPDSA